MLERNGVCSIVACLVSVADGVVSDSYFWPALNVLPFKILLTTIFNDFLNVVVF